MSLKSHFEAEFVFAKLDTETCDILRECYNIWAEQGHSGGSAGCLIGAMRGWKENLSPIEEKDSLLYGFSQLLFSRIGDSNYRETVLGLLIKLVSYSPLTPLTGEPEEWIDHGYGHKQNKRCGALFLDDDGVARYNDGRIFYRPSSFGGSFIGYGSYYSFTEVTFPWSEPDKPEKHFYLDDASRIEINPRHADAFYEIEYLRYGAGFLEGKYIRPESFFIDPTLCETLRETFLNFVKLMGRFDSETRRKAISSFEDATWSDAYENGEEIVKVDGEFRGDKIHRDLIYPIMRLIALIPNDAQLVDDKLTWFRGAVYKINFTTPRFPTKHFQGWTEDYKRFKGKVVVELERSNDRSDNYSYFDRVGYEIKYIGDDEDNYLYQMRRRFNLKHPEKLKGVRKPSLEIKADLTVEAGIIDVNIPNPDPA